jgi:hypothetical protein
VSQLPKVTDIGAGRAHCDTEIVPCRYCGYHGLFHIPAYPACGDDDPYFDSRVECPNCESTGPSACHDLDHFCESKDEARGRAVLAWNKRPATIINADAIDFEALAAELVRPDSPIFFVTPLDSVPIGGDQPIDDLKESRLNLGTPIESMSCHDIAEYVKKHGFADKVQALLEEKT